MYSDVIPLAEVAPPPYSPPPSAPPILPEHNSSRQFLHVHYAILQQEKELNSVRSLLSDSQFDTELKQRQQNLLTELQVLSARRKQLSAVLLCKNSPLNLIHRKQRLQTEVGNLTTLLRIARLARDSETIQVLGSQIKWNNIKLQIVSQKLAQTERRAFVLTLLRRFRGQPKTGAALLGSGVLLWKFGLAPLRVLLSVLGRLVLFLGRRLLTIGRPRPLLNFAILLFLSRWLGTRALFLLWILLALKFR